MGPAVRVELATYGLQKAGRISGDPAAREWCGIEVRKNCYPISVDRAGRVITAVVLEGFEDPRPVRVEAKAFIDASYEGDLMAVAGAPYRVGRESRSEYDEIHAGRIFDADYGDRELKRRRCGRGNP